MAKYYTSPELNDSGYIDLRPSQEGVLGVVASINPDFAAWWASTEVQYNIDMAYSGFDPMNPATYPSGFDIDEPDTWHVLFG